MCLVDRDGAGTWLDPRPGVFEDVRDLDGAWLEHLLAGTGVDVTYQHGVDELTELVRSDHTVTAGVLIRPVSVAEIERTAHEGLLMPPKSTFFTPSCAPGWYCASSVDQAASRSATTEATRASAAHVHEARTTLWATTSVRL